MAQPKQITNEQLTEAYSRHKSIYAVGRELGIRGSSAHERLVRLGIVCEGGGKHYTDEEIRIIKTEYAVYRRLGKVKELAKRLGRHYGSVTQEAHELGIGDATDERHWLGTWKYMSKECATALFDKFKRTRRGLGQFCAAFNFDEDGFRKTMRQFFRDEWDHLIETKAPRQSKYRLGRQLEYRVLDELKNKGFYAMRSPRSGGPVDVIGICKSLVVMVQCKRSGNINSKEWNVVLELAESVGAIPLLAATPTGRGTVYKRLTKQVSKGSKRQDCSVSYAIPYVNDLAY